MFKLFNKRETKKVNFNFLKQYRGWVLHTLECSSSRRIVSVAFHSSRKTAFLEPTDIVNHESANMERRKITLEVYTTPIPLSSGSHYFKFELTEESTRKLKKEIDAFKGFDLDTKIQEAKQAIGLLNND